MISTIVFPGQPVPQAAEEPSGHEPPDHIPAAVAVAMRFVQMGNEYMGPRCFVHHRPFEGETHEVVNVDLHAKQEAAFVQACNLIGTYFDAEIDRIERQRLLEAADFADLVRDAGAKLGLDREMQGEAD